MMGGREREHFMVNTAMRLVLLCCVQVPGLAVHVCQSLVSSTLANLPSEPYMNVEVMLRLFFLLGESISEKVYIVWLLRIHVLIYIYTAIRISS